MVIRVVNDGIQWVSCTYLVQTWKFIEELTQLRSQQQQQQTDLSLDRLQEILTCVYILIVREIEGLTAWLEWWATKDHG